MIINDLYTNNERIIDTGATAGEFQDKYTDTFYNIGMDQISLRAYYLGFISKDDLDVFSRASSVSVNGDIVTFTETTDSENFPIGYMVADGTGNGIDGTFMENGEMIKNVEQSTYTYSTWFADMRLINQMYPEYCGMDLSGTNVQLYFVIAYYSPQGAFLARTSASHSNIVGFDSTSVRSILNLFKYQDTQLSVSNSTYGDITFTAADMETPGFSVKTSIGNTARVFFTSYYVPGRYRIKNGSSSTSTTIMPFVTVTYDGGTKSYARMIYGSNYSFTDSYVFIQSYGSSNVVPRPQSYTQRYGQRQYHGFQRAGLHGSVNIANLSSTNPIAWDGNVLAYRGTDTYPNTYYVPIATLTDFKKAFCLAFRLDTGVLSNSYIDGVTYATDVTAADRFMADVKTGDIQDTIFKSTLRPWQYENFQTDEFEPEDVPPYDPGGGDRPAPEDFPDGENIGDDIETPDDVSIGSTLGFITQYCLNATQVAELGELLWTSFVDPDYWKNFMFSLALDTGSFNTSALLDFFISLRVYPFPLVNVPGYRSMGNNMFVGTGTVPLEFNNPLHAIDSYAILVDAGKRDVPFVFGDFRDCTNMEITLYLPYCGTVQLEAADVLGGTLHAKYRVDLATGSCTAVVDLTTWDKKKYPVAILTGAIGADVPLSATNAGQVAARLGSDVLNTAGIMISGAAGIADAAKTIVAGVAMENPLVAGAGAAQLVGAEAKTVGGLAQQGLDMVSRPGIGAPMLAGGRGFSAVGVPQKCYIQIRHPFYKKPSNYDSTEANPAAVQIQVSDCSGLCSFVNPDVSPIAATEEEKNQIRKALQSGVII